MTKLFGRSAALTIGLRGGAGKKYTDLRIAFDFKKTLKKGSNSGTIKIYNLSKESIADFQLVDDLYCILEIGYDNNLETLISGEVRFMMTEMQGPDRITTLELGDGHKSLNETYMFKTYRANFGVKNIIIDMVEEMK